MNLRIVLLLILPVITALPKPQPKGKKLRYDPKFTLSDFFDNPWHLHFYYVELTLISLLFVTAASLVFIFFFTRKHIDKLLMAPAFYVAVISAATQAPVMDYLIKRVKSYYYRFTFTTENCYSLYPGLYMAQYTALSVLTFILILEVAFKLRRCFRRSWLILALTISFSIIFLIIDVLIAIKAASELYENGILWFELIGKKHYYMTELQDAMEINQCRFDVFVYFSFYNGFCTFWKMFIISVLIIVNIAIVVYQRFKCCTCCQCCLRKDMVPTSRPLLVAEVIATTFAVAVFAVVAWAQSEIIRAAIINQRHENAWYVVTIANTVLLMCCFWNAVIYALKNRHSESTENRSLDMIIKPVTGGSGAYAFVNENPRKMSLPAIKYSQTVRPFDNAGVFVNESSSYKRRASHVPKLSEATRPTYQRADSHNRRYSKHSEVARPSFEGSPDVFSRDGQFFDSHPAWSAPRQYRRRMTVQPLEDIPESFEYVKKRNMSIGW